ncbi:UDP-glucose flavonoid 3-O-glucosyltransferase 7 [Acorus calamus]|uniref:UDP-glucose flavonoid 3-O-glucosyltransferase 7 n=1 Tax=Acorus calamus TaxID=4465 RepID=A0AAV9C554_ACOCL|nr:UDP-glucose flavonoid 3-O-glucosyltransferase 7 [Acorus calamus]
MSSVAGLFASHGVRCTIITTPADDHLVRRHTTKGDHPIDLLHLPLPSLEFPNQSQSDAAMRFFHSLESLRDPFDLLLREHHPDFVVSDAFLPWTAEIARNAGVPRLVFHIMGFFPLCMYEMLERSNFSYSPNRETIFIDSLPGHVSMKVSQVQDSALQRNDFSEFYERVMASNAESYGSIVNTFYELEPEYADHYKTAMGRKAWHVGPVNCLNTENDESGCVSWLDGQKPGSVVYVCFGSWWSRFTSEQLCGIAHGLKDSGRPYLWVIGNFYNEKLVVDVLKVGVAVGAEVWAMEEEMRPVIGREAVKGAGGEGDGWWDGGGGAAEEGKGGGGDGKGGGWEGWVIGY